MKKEAYIKPSMDILVMSTAGMLAASDHVSVDGSHDAGTEQRSKENPWSME